MSDLQKAIAAARDSLANDGHKASDALRDLLAALDAAQGEAVATVTSSNTAMTFSVVTPGFPDGTKLFAAPQAPPAAVPAALLEIGRRLAEDRKRNDHYTADPIYTVQREVRIYGLDADYAERFEWIEDSEVCASDLSERLERRFNRGWTIPERYSRVGYCTRWEFVDAYLSYGAAKERVEYESRKHQGTYRTYVESGCRNHEWKALQAWLLAAANKENNNG